MLAPVEVEAPLPPQGKVSPAELAELIGAFNEVTDRLHSTHRQLHAEVARLTGELRQANEQLERSRRLAALGEMAAGIAHEVRNPLGSIRLYARMLLEDLADRPQERQTVAKIDAACVGLAEIVEDLLMFAREFKVRKDLVPVSELFAAAIESCTEDRIAGIEQTQFVQVIEPRGLSVAMDRGLVSRAIVNIVRNAVQAMHESAAPDRRVTLSASLVEGACEIDIRDTGPGVPENVAARMFNPFFTTRETGTGLGLAIVHRIVEAHGGQVCVRSASPRGASVRIVLPDSDTTHPAACAAEFPSTTPLSLGRGHQAPSRAETHE